MSITYAPLPNWRTMFSILMGHSSRQWPDTSAFANEDKTTFWYPRSALILADIWRSRRSLTKNGPYAIWIPDYFCNQSLMPLRELGANIVFYPITKELEPDWIVCRELAGQSPPGLFVLAHYFGKLSDGAEARSFTDQFGAWLIEDAAHVLEPIVETDIVGDLIFYSTHKTLAVPSGAFLQIQNTDLAFERQNHPLGGAPLAWLIKRLVEKLSPDWLHRWRYATSLRPFDQDPPAQPCEAEAFVSRQSLAAMKQMSPNLHDYAQRRQRNCAAWRRLLLKRPFGVAPFHKKAVDEGAAPYRFIAAAETPDAAEAFYELVRSKGIPAESWPDLPPEVLSDAKMHASAIDLRRCLVFLPCHQTIEAHDIFL